MNTPTYDLDTTEGMNNAVAWTRQMFDQLRDGAAWGVPRSGTIIHINQKEKIATIVVGHTPDPSLRRVIEAMGWTVIER